MGRGVSKTAKKFRRLIWTAPIYRPTVRNDYSFLQIPDVPKPSQDVDSIEDWPAELRPSMRKLRQGMDSLCKTSKLTCSALRLRQTAEAVNLSHQIKYRRDVCFSQALTSLVTGLMNRLWCTAPSAAEADETFLKVYTLFFKCHSPHCYFRIF